MNQAVYMAAEKKKSRKRSHVQHNPTKASLYPFLSKKCLKPRIPSKRPRAMKLIDAFSY